jgi:hypothetical protein
VTVGIEIASISNDTSDFFHRLFYSQNDGTLSLKALAPKHMSIDVLGGVFKEGSDDVRIPAGC